MEALAIVGSTASIVQLIDTASKLSIHLYSFASTVGEAEEEINAIALEISLFANTLDQLRILFEKDNVQYSTAVRQNTENVIRSCRDLFNRYETLSNHLVNPNEEGGGIPMSISLTKTDRVKWAFKQKRVEVLRRRLAALQTNLLTMLHALTLSELQSLRSLVSEEPQRQAAINEQILRSYIMASRVSISSLEKAEDDAELATDESSPMRLQGEILGHINSRDDETGIFQGPLAKRDSIWLSAAILDVSSPSSQSSHKISRSSKAESSLLCNSIPEVKDLVSRYSVLLERDLRQSCQSDSIGNNSQEISKTPRSPALWEMQELSQGRKITGERLLRHQLNFQQKELQPTDHKNPQRFVIHAAIPVPNEEPPPEPAVDPKKKDRSKLPERITIQESSCKTLAIKNLKRLLAVLKDMDCRGFFDELSAIEQWFRVLSSDERLACLHRYLYYMKDFEPQLDLFLSQMFRDFYKSEGLHHFDLKVFLTIEKERIRAISDEDFIEELEVTKVWFNAISDMERKFAFAVIFHQASPSQAAFLCCH